MPCFIVSGSFVEFILDGNAACKQLQLTCLKDATARVEIRYLTSYERMGKARVSCVQGCECEGGEMDGMTREHWSIPESSTFNVSKLNKCVLRIEVLPGVKGEKFKILGVSVLINKPN